MIVVKLCIIVQSLSHDHLFASPWTAVLQASLSFTISQSLLKLMSIRLVMPSNHFIHPLTSPSPPASNLFQHQVLFQWLSSSHLLAKKLQLPFHYLSFQWISQLTSFRTEWFDLLAVQGTLKSLPIHHSSKAPILHRSAFFMVQH